MCGIAGFYSSEQYFSEQELKAMVQTLVHRGPDAEGFYFKNTIGLGHKRLTIIDLSSQANQPMASHSGNSKVVYNGEIYNFKEIAIELGIVQRTSSDTEIILEAFEKWGPQFVNKLNGMFAIAIYHEPSKKLYLFRDRIGIKPIFYYFQNNQLAFASEIKALLKLEKVAKSLEINSQAVSAFLHLGYIPAPATIYNTIYKFPQGHYAVFDGQEITFEPYWKITDKIAGTTVTNFSDAKAQLDDLLTQSVKYRLIADVPYGTFLSGGIDSSLVTALAQKVSNQQLKTFSIGFAESKFNESKYAQQVASHLQTDHNAFILTEDEALKLIPDFFGQFDEPFSDASAIPTMLVSKMARQQVTMTLSGDGGDELFHGYGMYKWANRLNNPYLQIIAPLLKPVLNQMGSKYKRVGQLLDLPKNETLKSHIFSQEQYLFSQKELTKLIQQKNQIILDTDPKLQRQLNYAEQQALFDLMYYLPDDLLTKVDRASMRFSLETRVPLLDYKVVEFALNLHPELKTKNSVQKYLLKELLFDYVPREYFNRPKWGFGIPLHSWLNTKLDYLVPEYLSEEKVTNAQLVSWPYTQTLLNKYRQPNNAYLYNRVWALICLHQWYYNTYLKINSSA